MNKLALALATFLLVAAGPPQVALPLIVPGGDASNTMVTAAGGTVARTAAARAADTLNVLDNGLKGDCTTGDQAALAALFGRISPPAPARTTIYFPVPPGGCYAWTAAAVEVPSNVELQPAPGVVLQSQAGGNGTFFKFTNQSNARVGAFVLDAQKGIHPAIAHPITVSGSNDLWFEGIKIVNPTDGFAVSKSTAIHILRPDIQNSLFQGVNFSNVSGSEIIGGTFQNGGNFGIILTGNSFGNLIEGNRTTLNAIELIGLTSQSHNNRIIGNHAEGAGDNCISVTGYQNVITGNELIGCAGNGLNLYGSSNVATGNFAKNNAQQAGSNPLWRAGFAIQQGFGGTGQQNLMSGNVSDDDQATKTQVYGVWISGPQYAAWAKSVSVKAGQYKTSGLNLYQAAGAGTTGATVPVCISGSCSDGSVTWNFVNAFYLTVLSDYNTVTGNAVYRSGTQSFLDSATGTHNYGIQCFSPLTNSNTAGQTNNNQCYGAASVAFGQFNSVGGPASFAAGSANTLANTATSSSAIGSNNLNSGANSLTQGQYATDRGKYAVSVLSGGRFTVAGDSQATSQILKGSVTGATLVRLTADGAAAGAANVINLPVTAAASYSLRITLMAIDVNAPANTYSWSMPIATLYKKGAAASTTTLALGTAITLATNSWAPTVSATADTTNGGLNLSFSPPTGSTDVVHIVARVESVEVE